MLPIYVINNFGQFNHLIHRALRDMDMEVAMVPNSTPAERVGPGRTAFTVTPVPAQVSANPREMASWAALVMP